MTAHEHRKAMTKLLKGMQPRHRLWEAFDAWTECAALSLANSVTLPGSPRWLEREERYKQITERFGGDAEAFSRILAHLIEALTLEPRDQLGQLASELEVLDKGNAQYFTPYDVSLLMAQLTYQRAELKELVDKRGYVTIHEPAAGAGGMIIAFSQVMRDAGLNPQKHLHATCWDIEATAAHMCFIQLSLLHVPAVVVIGNTITLEARQVLETPAHVLGLWRYRLNQPDEEPTPPPLTLGSQATQTALFDMEAIV